MPVPPFERNRRVRAKVLYDHVRHCCTAGHRPRPWRSDYSTRTQPDRPHAAALAGAKRNGRKILDNIRGLRIRLLGDRVLQDHAWRIAAQLDWPDTYQAEYIALTQLQADALATADRKLAAGARAFVETVSPADILRS